MSQKKILIIFLVLILSAGNAFFVIKYLKTQKELNRVSASLEIKNIDTQALNFTKMFIEKVLNAKGEVNFETRLKLETSVRDLKDGAILAQWQKFTDSKTESEAQTSVKDLLKLLVYKIEVH